MYDIKEINGENFLLGLCGAVNKKCVLRAESLTELEEWKADTLGTVRKMLGIDGIKPDTGAAELVCSQELGSYRKDKYILPTAENLKMPLYVLVPHDCSGKAIIALHGHGCYGKEGITGNIPEEIKVSDSNRSAFALEPAERGYIAVCPDILGSGERISGLGGDKAKSLCDLLNNTLCALGLSLQGVVLFELLRLVDFTLALKENRYKTAACLGFSGGGLFSLWLSALSKDISAAVVSGYFHTMSDTCLQSNKCGCNFVYGLWNTIDCGEIAALASPKPMYIELGREDKLHGRSGIESIYAQLETAKKAYSLYNMEENLQLSLCDGAHKWYASCYDFLENKTNWR